MELIQPGNEVLYIWRAQEMVGIEAQVTELKKIANVKLENSERLSLASHPKSSFDVIFVNVPAPETADGDSLKMLMNLAKPKGKVAFSGTVNEELVMNLLLAGMINARSDQTGNYVVAEKPNYETGSSMKLSFGKAKQLAEEAKKVWKLDDDDDEMINADELLDEEDKQKPSSESLKVCATTGKRKACKDCSCGLAEELDAEARGKNVDPNPTQKSSCGSCYLGDAFRCSTCPYLGLPAFKPGEKIQITDMMKNDV